MESRERNEAITQPRKQDILKHNMLQKKEVEPVYQCERSVSKERKLVKCNGCSGFYSRTYFARHKKICMGDTTVAPKSMPVEVLASLSVSTSCGLSEKFTTEIVECFSNDVGKLCKSDSGILRFGCQMFYKLAAQKDKVVEVKRSVMADMRRIASRYSNFLEQCREPHQNVDYSTMLCSR